MRIRRLSGFQTARAAMAVLALSVAALAQTTTAGKVVGSVLDPAGAVVPKAQVQLLNTDTNAAQSAGTDDAGGFVFPAVPPGAYKLTVKMAGFRTSVLPAFDVEVEKTVTVPVKLEVGGDKEVVEVMGTATALQTTDAQLGNVVSANDIVRLPQLQRNATELMNLQPATVAGGGNLTMRVAGAIDDQNTVTLDGIDITSNLVATNTSVPTPDDSVEEFRATVADPNATLMRASGGQISLIGRRGSNHFHGALYEYFQNNDLNANTWDNNRAGLAKATIHDNRFGGRIGGPVQKDKTFFFVNIEGRRFSSVAQVTRTVPTQTLRQGILEFPLSNGAVEQIDLKTAQICGANGNSACDPRGLGLSPTVAQELADMPLPNLAGGDGYNTGSYFANLPVPTSTNYGVIRLDHMFSEQAHPEHQPHLLVYQCDSVGRHFDPEWKPEFGGNHAAADDSSHGPTHLPDLADLPEYLPRRMGARHSPDQRNLTRQGGRHLESSRNADCGRTGCDHPRRWRQFLPRRPDRYGHAARAFPGPVATGPPAQRRHDQDFGQAPDPIWLSVEPVAVHSRPRR